MKILLPRLLGLLLVGLLWACDKSESGKPGESAGLLTKVNRWDPANNSETQLIQALYDSAGKVKSITIDPHTFQTEYTAQGKLSKLMGIDIQGRKLEYQLEYSGSGLLTTTKLFEQEPAGSLMRLSRIETFEHNAEGRVVKISSFEADGISLTGIKEFVWTKENIQESRVAVGKTPQERAQSLVVTSAMGYDNKANPMQKLGSIAEVLYSKPFPKNNPTQMKIKEGNATEFTTEAFPIYESKDGLISGLKFNLHEGNSLIHIPLSGAGQRGLRFYYE